MIYFFIKNFSHKNKSAYKEDTRGIFVVFHCFSTVESLYKAETIGAQT